MKTSIHSFIHSRLFNYCLKIWVFSAVVAPTLIVIFALFVDSTSSIPPSIFPIWFMIVIGNLIFSIPAFLMLCGATVMLLRFAFDSTYIAWQVFHSCMIIMSLYAILFFILLNGFEEPDFRKAITFFGLCAAYYLSLAAGCYLFKGELSRLDY